jgi:succinate-semialdehyde dehydrogenase/glutarate-semialdehyde dehydrogenase
LQGKVKGGFTVAIQEAWQRPNLYINGEFREARQQARYEVTNPANGALVGSAPSATAEDASDAVEAAAKAFKSWAGLTALDRSQLLRKFYEQMLVHQEDLAQLITAEEGKPLAEARGEAAIGAEYVAWYAEEARRVYGETVPGATPNQRILIFRQPVGVVGAITPWNFPVSMVTRKMAPALAAGCTVVLKPAEQTPLSALALADLAHRAGLPAGVFNVVTAEDPTAVGRVLLDDPRVRKLSFTGSTAVGKYLIRESADQVKKISMELGGHAPTLVFADADLDSAVAGVIAVARLTVGDGSQAGIDVGPLINREGLDKVAAQVQDAVSHGAVIACGGQRVGDASGHFYAPTVLLNVRPEMRIMHEETFGPVAPVVAFRDEAEAIALANDTVYGLASYVFTRDISRVFRVSEQLEYGIVGVNDPVPTVVQAPFGGVKESGFGREGGHWGMDPFLETKYVSIRI